MAIKDFMLAPQTNEQDDTATATISKKKPSIIYEQVEGNENDCDFVIKRTTSRTEQFLVIILSQGYAYIKQGDTVENLTSEKYVKFVADIPGESLEIETSWLKNLKRGKEFYEGALMPSINNKTIRNLITKKIGINRVKEIVNEIKYSYNDRNLFALMTAVPAITKYWDEQTLNAPSYRCTQVLENMLYMWDSFGIEWSRKYLDNLMMSNLNVNYSYYDLGWILPGKSKDIPWSMVNRGLIKTSADNPVVFDPEALIDYIIYDICRQGFADSGKYFINAWFDDIKMQNDIYGKIKDKYPEHLMSHHDQLAYLSRLKKQQIDAEKWELAVARMKDYEYEAQNSRLVIICPKTPQDMRDEAQMQQNCLAAYIQRVIDGERMIFFLRDKKNIDQSIVTIEVYPDGRVGQVLAKNNKRPDIDYIDFVSSWAKAKKLNYKYDVA